MGWNPFASESVTQVGTTVSRVVSDAATPDALKTGVIKALFNKGDLPEYILEEMIASIAVRAEKMYRYANDNYTYGMPSGEQYSSAQGRPQVEAFLEAQEGTQISIEYSHYGSPNALHMAWMTLVSSHGYDTNTNQLATLTAQKGTPVYLKDMVVVVPEDQATTIERSMLSQWGSPACAGYTPERLSGGSDFTFMTAPTPIMLDPTATSIHTVVTYTWVKTVPGVYPGSVITTIEEGSFTIPFSGFDYRDGYFMVKYFVGTQAKYWRYLNKSGTYPVLDNIFVDAPAETGSYFPMIYFRFNKTSATADTTTDAYKTSKKMCKIMGMDFDAVSAAINENPDIANVEQAMLTFAIPAVSTNKQENQYLFDYFDTLYQELGDDFANNYLANTLNSMGATFNENMHAIIIQDTRFKMTLGHNGITKRTRGGVIGAVGTCTSNYALVYVDQEVTDSDGNTYLGRWPVRIHTYQRQLSTNFYEEIKVTGLQMTYNIFGGYNTVGDESDPILLIPIDRTISETYSMSDREILYSRSLHFVFNSLTVTEVEWYQQEWFSTFLIIVAVVITVSSGGSDGGQALAAAMGLEGTAALIAIVIIDVVLTGMLMAKVFSVFVKMVGADVATVLVIAALMYGAYQLNANGMKGIPMAKDMLMLSTGLESAVLKSQMSDLMGEYESFQSYADEQERRLTEAQKLLETSTILSPFVIFGEKPEDFYNRTVHYGNIGTLGITAVSSYVDIAITLPKVQDTLGEPIYG